MIADGGKIGLNGVSFQFFFVKVCEEQCYMFCGSSSQMGIFTEEILESDHFRPVGRQCCRLERCIQDALESNAKLPGSTCHGTSSG